MRGQIGTFYSYIVNRNKLSDDQIKSLGGRKEVVSEYSPREFRTFNCADCIFPNGDTYPLEPDAIDIISGKALDE